MGLAQSFFRGEHGTKRKRMRSETNSDSDSDDSTLNRALHTRKRSFS